MPFPTHQQAAEVFQPCEQAFDFPAAFGTPQFSPVLAVGSGAITTVRGNQLDSMFLGEKIVQSVAVIAPISNQARGLWGDEAMLDRSVRSTIYEIASQYSVVCCQGWSLIGFRVGTSGIGDWSVGSWFPHFENQDLWAVSFFFNFHFRGGAGGLSERGGVGFAEVLGISMHAGETGEFEAPRAGAL